MENRIKEIIEGYKDEVIKARHRFHEYPELSMVEYETVKYIEKVLEEHGIPFEDVNKTSCIAIIDSGKPGRTVGVRGDIDALPIQEKVDIPYVSKIPGVSHACGHDCHGAMALGVALALNECKDAFNGVVKVVFQEGEEVGLGAKHVVDSTHTMDDCEAIFALHMNPYLDCGVFGTCAGPMFAAAHQGRILVEGTSGHGSIPEKSVNPVTVAAHIIMAIEHFAAYGYDAFSPYVLVPTMIDGGTKVNNIASTTEIAFDCRYFNEEFKQQMDSKFITLVEKTAEAFGAKATVTYDDTAIVPLFNDKELVKKANKLICEEFGEANLTDYPAEMGSEDFGVFLNVKKVPGFYAYLGAAENGRYTPFHGENTYYSDRALLPGVHFLVAFTLQYLNE